MQFRNTNLILLILMKRSSTFSNEKEREEGLPSSLGSFTHTPMVDTKLSIILVLQPGQSVFLRNPKMWNTLQANSFPPDVYFPGRAFRIWQNAYCTHLHDGKVKKRDSIGARKIKTKQIIKQKTQTRMTRRAQMTNNNRLQTDFQLMQGAMRLELIK